MNSSVATNCQNMDLFLVLCECREVFFATISLKVADKKIVDIFTFRELPFALTVWITIKY